MCKMLSTLPPPAPISQKPHRLALRLMLHSTFTCYLPPPPPHPLNPIFPPRPPFLLSPPLPTTTQTHNTRSTHLGSMQYSG